jgi:hypothetical protein
MIPRMPDDLYDRDALAWSEHQADLLRRLARGERVNDVDWAHVVEEIEDVGLAELHAVESCLDQMLVHRATCKTPRRPCAKVHGCKQPWVEFGLFFQTRSISGNKRPAFHLFRQARGSVAL